MRKSIKKCGFSLIEVMLAIAIIALLGGIAVPIYQNFLFQDDLTIATNTTAESLRRAQFLSQSVEGDESWGVYLGNSKITLFKGSSYATREVDFDEDFKLEASIAPTGINEIVFDKFTGYPQQVGDIILSTENETKTITINEKGIVSYQ